MSGVIIYTPNYQAALDDNYYAEIIAIVDADIALLKGRNLTPNDVATLKSVAMIAAEKGECDLMELAIILSAVNTIGN
jgi:hypothetical protein